MQLTLQRPDGRRADIEVSTGVPFGVLAPHLRRLTGHAGHFTVTGSPVGTGQRTGLPPLSPGAVLTAGPSGPDVVARSAATTWHLAVLAGPEAGQCLPLEPGRRTLGRSPRCDVPLADPALSRAHAHLWVRAERLGDRELADALAQVFDSATDALRAAAAWAGFSPALEPVRVVGVHRWEDKGWYVTESKPTYTYEGLIRFGSFPGRVRRTLLGVVDRDPYAEAALARRPGLWITLGERLHPGDYARPLPRAYAAFTALRRGTARPANSALEVACQAGDVPGALAATRGRPGELVRRLDQLLRSAPAPADVQALLARIDAHGHEVATRVLWQAHAHLVDRDAIQARAIAPKGSVSRMQVLPPFAAPLPADAAAAVIEHLGSAIGRAYAKRPPLEDRWWVEESLERIRIPNAVRDATTGFDLVGRGSRVDLPELAGRKAATVRLFVHWHDLPGESEWDRRVDVDLSAVLYDKKLERVGQTWWGQLRGDGVVHSGDFTSAPEGAAEYVDLDLAALRRRGVRYAAASVISFTGQGLAEIPELYAGVQVRGDKPQAGQVYDPRTVATKFALGSPGTATVPLLVDVVAGQMIWVDVDLQARDRSAARSVQSTAVSERQVLLGVLSLTGPNVADVVRANVRARGGELVAERADADHEVTRGVDGLSIPMTQLLAEWL